MPKGHPLTTEQRERIYDLHTMNVSHEDIADQFGVTVDTINRCVGKQRKLYEQRKEDQVAEIVVAGDKKNGRLVSNGTNRYEGTCIVKGKSKSRAFLAGNAHVAEEQWRKWCQDLRDEQTFMDMVERKPKEEGFVPADESPVDPFEEPKGEPEPKEKPVYIIWLKGEEPKFYGAYGDMDAAINDADRLNDVASFLGGGSTFEVEEVAWKSR